ncbi:MAG: MaoC family dehydratase [Alphaproteobacteria bacterium]|nr:MaoC family dehydratase [Alphaproteobacteria bacterium]
MRSRKLRYWEDIAIGTKREGGGKIVTAAEIIAFASKYDPQYFHTDPKAAEKSIYGGLIASGWHTAAMMMRMLVDGFNNDTASLGSPGFDTLRWYMPVRPGDILSVRSVCVDKAPSQSRPGTGSCRFQTEVLNQKGEVVMSLITIGMYRRRPQGEETPT